MSRGEDHGLKGSAQAMAQNLLHTCTQQHMMSRFLLWFLFALVTHAAADTFLDLSADLSVSYLQAPYYNSPVSSPSSFEPSTAPDSLVPLLPSSPLYPLIPNGPMSQPASGLCSLDIPVLAQVIQKTAVDCMAPLAMYVGGVICCPQFGSLMRIVQGELSSTTGSLVLNSTSASLCFSEAMSFLIDLGANETIPDLCSVKPENLTGGSCPVTSVVEFEKEASVSELLSACTSIDSLKECCQPVCEKAINYAVVRLAQRSFEADGGMNVEQQQVLDDCRGVVLAWLASRLGPEAGNSVFRNLDSCKVNKACPLMLQNPSSVVKTCGGPSPLNTTCCSSLYRYISELQSQMLITNVQALNCVTLFGSMLLRRGITTNVYKLCQVDLKDFSLQVHGEQGCLLRAVPSDVINDKLSGISFTCDLNDNIAAPWPLDASQSSFSLCASSFLPALPAPHVSACGGGLKGKAPWKITAMQTCTFLALSMWKAHV